MAREPVLEDEIVKARRAAFRRALNMITGKWKLEILWLLDQRMHRFGELRKGIAGITQHMLWIGRRKALTERSRRGRSGSMKFKTRTG